MNFLEEIIRNAQAKGEFDNLKGEGKPLKREEHPLAGENKMAFKMVKEAGFTLPFIEEQQKLRAQLEEIKNKLLTAGRSYTGDPFSTTRWKHAQRIFRAEAADYNKAARTYNLKAPHVKFHVHPLMIDRFIEQQEAEMGDTP